MLIYYKIAILKTVSLIYNFRINSKNSKSRHTIFLCLGEDLFPNLERVLQGKQFYPNEEIKWEADAFFETLDKSYYMKGVEMLEERWKKCIALEGDYVEE